VKSGLQAGNANHNRLAGFSERGMVMTRRPDTEMMLDLIPTDGTPVGNVTLIQKLGWKEEKYWRVRNTLLEQGYLERGKGKGGSVKKPSQAGGPAARKSTYGSAEAHLYKPLLSVLANDWVQEMRMDPDQIVFEITAWKGKKPFAREYAADWRVGQWDDPDLRLAFAVAASAAFPPMLSPARIRPPKNSIRAWSEPTTLTASGFRKRLFLTDGGVYDNLGLEPVWKRYRTLLVSDGGAVTQPVARPWTNWYSQFRRVLDVSLQQGINTRIRIPYGLDRSGARTIAYWGISTPAITMAAVIR
jgi:hypothetical protein